MQCAYYMAGPVIEFNDVCSFFFGGEGKRCALAEQLDGPWCGWERDIGQTIRIYGFVGCHTCIDSGYGVCDTAPRSSNIVAIMGDKRRKPISWACGRVAIACTIIPAWKFH